jgi:hypothetical protein
MSMQEQNMEKMTDQTSQPPEQDPVIAQRNADLVFIMQSLGKVFPNAGIVLFIFDKDSQGLPRLNHVSNAPPAITLKAIKEWVQRKEDK